MIVLAFNRKPPRRSLLSPSQMQAIASARDCCAPSLRPIFLAQLHSRIRSHRQSGTAITDPLLQNLIECTIAEIAALELTP